ncbi:MAG: hypothetical protein KKC46_13190 [Proteobacteria bacterium]|nr:hypothetical protein [Pseudomonadota bacterium]
MGKRGLRGNHSQSTQRSQRYSEIRKIKIAVKKISDRIYRINRKYFRPLRKERPEACIRFAESGGKCIGDFAGQAFLLLFSIASGNGLLPVRLPAGR